VKYFQKDESALFHNTSLASYERTAFISTMTEVIEANQRNRKFLAHKICREFVGTINIVMYFQKDFFLVEAINQKINCFISSGIMNHIIEKYIDSKFLGFEEPVKGPRQLTLTHLKGAFYVWMICCGVSVGVLICEIFSNIVRKLKKKSSNT
jgi:hypothetical protein